MDKKLIQATKSKPTIRIKELNGGIVMKLTREEMLRALQIYVEKAWSSSLGTENVGVEGFRFLRSDRFAIEIDLTRGTKK